jgi:putative membrane protein
MNYSIQLLAGISVALALTACNRSPTTPQPEPTTTTPEAPSPSNTPSSSAPPSTPTTPPGSSNMPPPASEQPPSPTQPSTLPPPATPSGQGGPNSSLTPEPGDMQHPLQRTALDTPPEGLPRATDNGAAKPARKSASEKAREDAKSSLAGNDRNFIQRVGNDGQSEEQAALYVASKTFNNDVRSYAARVGQEHGKANQQLRELAVVRGIELPSDPEGVMRVKLDRLRQMTGPQMDRTFLQDFGIQGHQDAIALFEQQVSQSKDVELKEFAARLLPVLREHYSQARGLQQKYAPVTGKLSI